MTDTNGTETALQSRAGRVSRKGNASDIMWAAYVVSVALELWLLPGAPFIPTAIALILMTVCVLGVYRHTAGWSTTGEAVLIGSAMLISFGLILNVYTYTTYYGGTDSAPVLFNTDAQRNFTDTMYHLGQSDMRSYYTHGLYPAVIAGIFAITGPSITAGICLSAICTLFTLVCVSSLWVRLTGDRARAWLCMACTAAVCYLMMEGTILLKDAWCILAIAMAATGLAKPSGAGGIILGAAGALMLLVARSNMILGLIPGAITFWMASPRKRTETRFYVSALLVFTAAYIGAEILNWTPMTTTVIGVNDNDIYFNEERQAGYIETVGNFVEMPLWQRVLAMPFCAVLQFLLPFPWNYMRDVPFGMFEAYAHFQLPWYLFGGLFIYYLGGTWRRSPRPVLACALWALLLWLVPVWCFGGTISRYGLMAVPLAAPAVAFTLQDSPRRRSLRIFALIFIILLVASLIVCHHIQSAAMQ